MKLSREQVEAGKTARGGFSRKQLAEWGVSWPPPKGWRRKLEGNTVPHDAYSRLDLPAWNYSDPRLFEAERLRQEMKAIYLEKSKDFPELTPEQLRFLENS